MISASVALMPCFSASRSIHWKEISSPTICWRSWSYCAWHCFLKSASVCFGCPSAGLAAAFLACAMHSVKAGGLSSALSPCALDFTATFIQCSKSCFWIALPSTSATALPGRLFSPHPARIAAGTKKAPSARTVSFLFMIGVEPSVCVIKRG